ncbi:MAG: hypothetical protein Ct9H300mP31_06460 [Acidimicrobiaceae bacterium]|nr:MAG: hypothetical protein Ct9H300mP31_06460 [Acidimicrobiaceae bacterium]
MRVIGHKPCNPATLEESMGVIKGLAEGDVVEYNGTTQTLPWRPMGHCPCGWPPTGRRPWTLRAQGRRVCTPVGRPADRRVDHCRVSGRGDAGRDPESLTSPWWLRPTWRTPPTSATRCVGSAGWSEPRGRPRRPVWRRRVGGPQALPNTSRGGRATTTRNTVGPATSTPIRTRRGHRPVLHPRRRGCPHRRLRELESLGVDQFAIYLMHDQKDETLDAYGRKIIPALAR